MYSFEQEFRHINLYVVEIYKSMVNIKLILLPFVYNRKHFLPVIENKRQKC
jgi:hypothetical protein